MNLRQLFSRFSGVQTVDPSADANQAGPSDFQGHRAGERRIIGGIAFRWCPPTGPQGFVMGSPLTEQGRSEEEIQHTVVLSHGFWMGETVVTQGQWKELVGTDLRAQAVKALEDETLYPVGGKMQTTRDYLRLQRGDADKIIYGCEPEIPIFWVNWEEAADFCQRLNQRERRSGNVPVNWHIQLPTEAEWEWACRAGTATATYAGEIEILEPKLAPILEDIAWYGGNHKVGKPGPNPVAQKKPNAWGLFDMLGNVWEWCADRYGPYPTELTKDPEGPATNGGERILRGGSRWGAAKDFRAANRTWGYPAFRNGPQGFRLTIVRGN